MTFQMTISKKVMSQIIPAALIKLAAAMALGMLAASCGELDWDDFDAFDVFEVHNDHSYHA